jgi:hypothetical protein
VETRASPLLFAGAAHVAPKYASPSETIQIL